MVPYYHKPFLLANYIELQSFYGSAEECKNAGLQTQHIMTVAITAAGTQPAELTCTPK